MPPHVSRPHRSLLSTLLATAVVITLVLGWFGQKAVSDHRILQQEQLRARVDAGADVLAADVRGRLAEIGERLNGWLVRPESTLPTLDGAVVFGARASGV